MKIKRLFLYLLPPLIFILPALVGISIDVYNRYYRGVASPLPCISYGLILISLFFLIRKRLAYFILTTLTFFYLVVFFVLGLWKGLDPRSAVYYYRNWWLNTRDGRIHLQEPLGNYPPATGPYITCSFTLRSWRDYLDNQPVLCTAFDKQLRMKMFLIDHDTESGILREFQMNEFRVERKSLLGDPLDRAAIRIAFIGTDKGLWPKYRIREIYQVFEKTIEGGQSRVIESISRNPQGRLKSFTESSLLNLTDKDVYAVYNAQGLLTEIPRLLGKTFVFPGKIDVGPILDYLLPERLEPGE